MIPATHHGRFAGPNRLWFMPGTPAHRSDGVLVVSATRVDVEWSHEGKAHRGSIALSGPAPACAAQFTDTFHAEKGMAFHGRGQGSGLVLYGTYPAGDGSPDWGWRIEMDWADPEHLHLRMFNVLPDGLEALAVDLRGART